MNGNKKPKHPILAAIKGFNNRSSVCALVYKKDFNYLVDKEHMPYINNFLNSLDPTIVVFLGYEEQCIAHQEEYKDTVLIKELERLIKNYLQK